MTSARLGDLVLDCKEVKVEFWSDALEDAQESKGFPRNLLGNPWLPFKGLL